MTMEIIKLGIELLLMSFLVWNLIVQTKYGGKLKEYLEATSAEAVLTSLKSQKELLVISQKDVTMYRNERSVSLNIPDYTLKQSRIWYRFLPIGGYG